MAAGSGSVAVSVLALEGTKKQDSTADSSDDNPGVDLCGAAAECLVAYLDVSAAVGINLGSRRLGDADKGVIYSEMV